MEENNIETASVSRGSIVGAGITNQVVSPATLNLRCGTEELVRSFEGRFGIHDVACPECGPGRREPANRKRHVLRVWHSQPGYLTYFCARCGIHGWVRTEGAAHSTSASVNRARAAALQRNEEEIACRRRLARKLWAASAPAQGTIVETYLQSRAIELTAIPATIRYLPARRPEHHPAMISPFAITNEPEPARLAVSPNAIRGVHLTFLRPDGCGKALVEPEKIMVAPSIGVPIIVAPMSDGLGLIISEGIEDALSAHIATGLGSWAAGSAGRMPALANVVPTYVEAVTIIADHDEDGQRGAHELAKRLRARGHDVILTTFDARGTEV